MQPLATDASTYCPLAQGGGGEGGGDTGEGGSAGKSQAQTQMRVESQSVELCAWL